MIILDNSSEGKEFSCIAGYLDSVPKLGRSPREENGFNISPSNEHPGLISFRIYWFDLLAVQGNLKSLLQHHILKASVLWFSVFFMVQLSHLYLTTGKTIALTIQTFVGKVMCLLFNMLSSSSKEQASFNFMAGVTIYSDFGAQENKVCHCFHCSPSICHEVM